jgi:diguanylate cyclase (GGDEF)-like protein/PAS domain S-box-containing protein
MLGRNGWQGPADRDVNMHTLSQARHQPLSRRLMPLAYALIAAAVVILLLTWGAFQIQVAMAGFLHGESEWSKAQKQAVIDLDSYAATGESSYLAQFKTNYALLNSDRWARDAIASGTYERERVNEAFLRGNILPQAQPEMIFILQHLSAAPNISTAIRAWRQTDAPLSELNAIAKALENAYASPAGTLSAQASIARARINGINREIGPLTQQFSLEIAFAASWAGKALFGTVVLSTILIALLWRSFAARILAGIRSTEERFSLLFESTADGIVLLDDGSDRVVDLNQTASRWLGVAREQIVGKPFAGLFVDAGPTKGRQAVGRLNNSDGQTRPVETHSSVVMWGDQAVRIALIRDISDRVSRDQERRIAAEALASIAEGVIIADASKTVTTANEASFTLTGFSIERQRRIPFGATRCLPDGESLPPSFWQTIAQTGHWQGEVLSRRYDGSRYPEQLSVSAIRDDFGEVNQYVAVFTDISAAKSSRERLEYLASHDTLTGLLNRAEFEALCTSAIDHAARNRRMFAVLFIDLDSFKIVNDSLSHAVGDTLLVSVAQRIQHQLGVGDVAGRIGGDEFTVLLTNLTTREDAHGFVTRLLAALSSPYPMLDREIVISASIGIAGYPLDGDTAVTLLASADAAMHTAKRSERNAYRYYLPVMQADQKRRLRLSSELRQAVGNRDEFCLVYQPSYDMATGRIVGAEALVRWNHPDGGTLLPADFIPLAESVGHIRAIDQWVVRTTLSQIRKWDVQGMAAIRIGINVSAQWFGHPAFADFLQAALQEFGTDPARVMLELTESALLRLGEDTDQTMKRMAALGVGVAIDDFGTGHASLSYLKLPAINCLKLDRTFTEGLPSNPVDVEIVRAILSVAKGLGLHTIAEGVELEEQRAFLQSAGCGEAQGFFYSRPLTPEQLLGQVRPRGAANRTPLRSVTNATNSKA